MFCASHVLLLLPFSRLKTKRNGKQDDVIVNTGTFEARSGKQNISAVLFSATNLIGPVVCHSFPLSNDSTSLHQLAHHVMEASRNKIRHKSCLLTAQKLNFSICKWGPSGNYFSPSATEANVKVGRLRRFSHAKSAKCKVRTSIVNLLTYSHRVTLWLSRPMLVTCPPDYNQTKALETLYIFGFGYKAIGWTVERWIGQKYGNSALSSAFGPEFAAQRVTGSSWTHKIFYRAAQGLSNSVHSRRQTWSDRADKGVGNSPTSEEKMHKNLPPTSWYANWCDL